MNEKESFSQFQYCQLCHVSHKKKRKHIFGKKHQEIIKNILAKYRKKITGAKSTLINPMLEEHNFESGAKFWCYFCVEEVEKHEPLQEFTVKFSGLLEHIASKSHSENTSKFLRNNAVWEKTTKPDFILDEATINSYKERVITALRVKEKERVQQRCQEMFKIRQQERTRLFINQSAARESERNMSRYASHSHNASATMAADVAVQVRIKGRRTIGAFAEGLTYVQLKSTDNSSGNIFTGAVPPWMKQGGQGDASPLAGPDVNLSHNAPGSTQDIGPSLVEYEKHLAREKKGKLPSTRVGATFDHKVDTSTHWLPSFGRLWSKNRRATSKQQFQFHLKRDAAVQKAFPRQQLPASSARGSRYSISPSDTDSQRNTIQNIPDINHVVPYKRKRVTAPVDTAAAASSSNRSTEIANHVPLSFLQSSPVNSSQQPIRSRQMSMPGMNFDINSSSTHIQTPVLKTESSFIRANVNRNIPSHAYTPLSNQTVIPAMPVHVGLYRRTMITDGVFSKASQGSMPSQSNKTLPSQNVATAAVISLITTPLLNKK